MRKALLPVFVFAKIDIRRLFRDKVAIFFTIFFPLIFLFIFGTINSGDNNIKFNVAVINQSDNEFAKNFYSSLQKNDILEVDPNITNVAQAQDKMSRSEIDATIVLPPEFGAIEKNRDYPSGQVKVLFNENNRQAATALSSALAGITKNINNELVPSVEPIQVSAESTAQNGVSQFDYVFAGLLGFSILSLGVFGPGSVFPRLKSKGVLRRYRTTTLKVWQYFLGNVLSTASIGLISVAIMFLIALQVFDLQMRGSYLSLIPFVILSTVTIYGIGLAVGGWAKNENQAAPVTQLVAFPMLFLSGTFFPRFIMPDWLQGISTFLPLTPVIDGIRLIITEGQGLMQLGTQVGLIVLWAVIVYSVAFKVFRWE
jgi:ABC-2 type transport system permease protein